MKILFGRGVAVGIAAVALTLVSTIPGNAATTSEWQLKWSTLSTTGSMYSVVAISRTNAWATGATYHGQTPVNNPYVLHWNGARWSGVSIPGGSGYASALVAASSASNVWILGTDVNGSLNQKFFRYDGTRWHTIATPEGNLSTLAVLSPTDVWASGQISCTGKACVTDVWQWNGSKWLAHPIGTTAYNIAGTAATGIWVAGINGVNQATGEGLVAAYRWTGTRWFPVVMPHPEMSGWVGIAIGSASAIWIEGWRGTSSQVLTLQWTGRTWQHVISAAAMNASPDPVADGSGGVWMGPWVHWTGRSWVIVPLSFVGNAGLGIHDFAKVPGTSGSYWGAGGIYKNDSSMTTNPAMAVYGPVP
jgi:hypothetical protein